MDARSCTCLCWPWAPLRAAWQHKATHGRPRTQLGGRTHHGQSLGVIVRSWDVHHLSFIIFFSNRVFSTSFPNSPASAVTIEASLYQTSVYSLVDFRKPLCGTAPSVIPILLADLDCRCAFLDLFLFFLSSCFSLLLPGADMS